MGDRVDTYKPSLLSGNTPQQEAPRRFSQTQSPSPRTMAVGDPFNAPRPAPLNASREAAYGPYEATLQGLSNAVDNAPHPDAHAGEFLRWVQAIPNIGSSSSPTQQELTVKAALAKVITGRLEVASFSPEQTGALREAFTSRGLDDIAKLFKAPVQSNSHDELSANAGRDSVNWQHRPRYSEEQKRPADEDSTHIATLLPQPEPNLRTRNSREPAVDDSDLPKLPGSEKATTRAVSQLLAILQQPGVFGQARDPKLVQQLHQIVTRLPRGYGHDAEFHRIFRAQWYAPENDALRNIADRNIDYLLGPSLRDLVRAAIKGEAAPVARQDYANREISKLFHLLEVSGTTGRKAPYSVPHQFAPFWILDSLKNNEFPTEHFDYNKWLSIADTQLEGMTAAQLETIQKGIDNEYGSLMSVGGTEKGLEPPAYKRLLPLMLRDAVESKLQRVRAEADRPRNNLQRASKFLARPFKAVWALRHRRAARLEQVHKQTLKIIGDSLGNLSRPTNSLDNVERALNLMIDTVSGTREPNLLQMFAYFALGRSPRAVALHPEPRRAPSEKERIAFDANIQLALSKLNTTQVAAILDNVERRRPQKTDSIHVADLLKILNEELQRRTESSPQRVEIGPNLKLSLQQASASDFRKLDDKVLHAAHDVFQQFEGFDEVIPLSGAEMKSRSVEAQRMYTYHMGIAMTELKKGNFGHAVTAMEAASATADQLARLNLHAAGIPINAASLKLQRQELMAAAWPPERMPRSDLFQRLRHDKLRNVDAAFRKLSGDENGKGLTGNVIPKRVTQAKERYANDFRAVKNSMMDALVDIDLEPVLPAIAKAAHSAEQLLVWEQHARGVGMAANEASEFLQACVNGELRQYSDSELSFILQVTQRGFSEPGHWAEMMDALRFYERNPNLAERGMDLVKMASGFDNMRRITEGARLVLTERGVPVPAELPEPQPQELTEPSDAMKNLLNNAFSASFS